MTAQFILNQLRFYSVTMAKTKIRKDRCKAIKGKSKLNMDLMECSKRLGELKKEIAEYLNYFDNNERAIIEDYYINGKSWEYAIGLNDSEASTSTSNQNYKKYIEKRTKSIHRKIEQLL